MERENLGKLIDGVLIKPSQQEYTKIIVTNPSDESLKFNMGYKDVVSDEEPTYDIETQHLDPYYEETSTLITIHYNIVENVDEINEVE